MSPEILWLYYHQQCVCSIHFDVSFYLLLWHCRTINEKHINTVWIMPMGQMNCSTEDTFFSLHLLLVLLNQCTHTQLHTDTTNEKATAIKETHIDRKRGQMSKNVKVSNHSYGVISCFGVHRLFFLYFG